MNCRSVLALFAFCATVTAVASMVLAIVLAGATVAFAIAGEAAWGLTSEPGQTAQPPSRETLFAGMITDDRCSARHVPSSDSSPAECVQACVRKGAHYMLVDGDKSYRLDGSEDKFSKVAGQRANVLGELSGDTIRVSAVSTAQ